MYILYYSLDKKGDSYAKFIWKRVVVSKVIINFVDVFKGSFFLATTYFIYNSYISTAEPYVYYISSIKKVYYINVHMYINI